MTGSNCLFLLMLLCARVAKVMELKEPYSFGVAISKYVRAVKSIRKQIHDPDFKNGQTLLDILQRLHNSTIRVEMAVNGTKAGPLFEMLLVMSMRILDASYRKYSTIKINVRQLRQRFSWTKEDVKKFVCLFRDLKRSFNVLNETYVTTHQRKEEERKKRGIVRQISEVVASLKEKYYNLKSAERHKIEREYWRRKEKKKRELMKVKERRKEKMAKERKKEEKAKETKKKETTTLAFSKEEDSDRYDSESRDSYDSESYESYDSKSRESYDSRLTS